MCDVKEAQRHEQLAEIYENENNKAKAVEHYLEATAIYVLNIQLLKNESLLLKANECYQKVQKLRKEKLQDFTKTELAKLVVRDLDFKSECNHHQESNHNHYHTHKNNSPHHHNKLNLLSEIEELL